MLTHFFLYDAYWWEVMVIACGGVNDGGSGYGDGYFLHREWNLEKMDAELAEYRLGDLSDAMRWSHFMLIPNRRIQKQFM